MQFDFSPKVKELQASLTAFMEEYIYPNEKRWHDGIESGDRWQPSEVIEQLKPKVPVLVRCDPRAEAKLAIKREDLAPATREPSQEDWCVTLPVDPDYRAEAHDSTGKQLGEREFIVRPPCQRVVIPTGGS